MSCQDVCIDMDYDGSTEFYREETRRAAKPYVCCECRGMIAKGDAHQLAAGKSEGFFWQERTCAVCAEIRTAYCCGSWSLGELWESIRDQMLPRWDEMTAIDCLAKLTSQPAIDKMRGEYAKWQEDQS